MYKILEKCRGGFSIPTKIFANCLYASLEGEADDAFILIGFADNENNTNDYITLQKSIKSPVDDIDQIYIEYKDQLQSCYGGITKIVLCYNKIIIYLKEPTAKTFGTEECIEVFFNQEAEILNKVKDYLFQMFKDIEISEGDENGRYY